MHLQPLEQRERSRCTITLNENTLMGSLIRSRHDTEGQLVDLPPCFRHLSLALSTSSPIPIESIVRGSSVRELIIGAGIGIGGVQPERGLGAMVSGVVETLG